VILTRELSLVKDNRGLIQGLYVNVNSAA